MHDGKMYQKNGNASKAITIFGLSAGLLNGI